MTIVFIGGFFDAKSLIVKKYQEAYEEAFPEIKTVYFEWSEKRKIKNFLETVKGELICIGHSYGAATAVSLLQKQQADILITVDPVSRLSTHKRPKVKKWIDINAKPTKYDLSDYIAWLGGKWDRKPKEDVDEYYEVSTHHGRFEEMLENIFPL